MKLKADAWLLYAGDGSKPSRATLRRETIELAPPGPGEVIAEPLYGCWEGNMGHALDRRPVDICRQRGEPRVVIGNAGVVRVRQCGEGVRLEPGQYAIIFCTGVEDRWGYPDKILGYDAPGTMGCLSTLMRVRERQLIPVPEGTRHSLAQWAAFSLRYITAWANWQLASGVFRLSVPEDECPSPHVWSWGGGVSLATLDLARRHGWRTVMLSGSDHHLATIEQAGITALDRRQFGELCCDEARYASDPAYRREYKEKERALEAEVRSRTDGEMVQVFVDYVGAPVYRLTLRLLSREGVITTAGWKEGMELRHLRAKECIDRHQHVHTHYARYSQGVEAVRYAEETGWMPRVDERIYPFGEIPALAEDYHAERTSYFPCFSVNPC